MKEVTVVAAPKVIEVAAAVTAEPANEGSEFSIFNLGIAEEKKYELPERIAGLSDREAFDKDLDRRLSEVHRTGGAASIALLEIDGFVGIVNEFGAKAGELVLRTTAQIVKAALRDMDNGARYDDHVLALMLPGASINDASAAAERIRMAVANCKLPVNGEELRFSVSLGVAELGHSETREEVLSKAGQALSAARDAGGNRSLAFHEENENRAVEMSP